MSEPKKAEIELVGGTTITGKVVTADVDAATVAEGGWLCRNFGST